MKTLIEKAEEQLEQREMFLKNLHISDCDNCRRRTMSSSQFPQGICMAFNQDPGFVYDRCLKAGMFEPKVCQTAMG